jgi:hypothetical protein
MPAVTKPRKERFKHNFKEIASVLCTIENSKQRGEKLEMGV